MSFNSFYRTDWFSVSICTFYKWPNTRIWSPYAFLGGSWQTTNVWFLCSFTSMDGTANNRSFKKINFADKNSRIVKNPCNFEEKLFLMDYSHDVKKIWNNILTSGIEKGYSWNLKLVSGEPIQLQMFQDCYTWDKKDALQIHTRLTNEHLYPSQQSKTRNHLAEEVFDEETIHILLEYQSTLGKNGFILNGPIKLLQQTSKLERIFRDRRTVMNLMMKD